MRVEFGPGIAQKIIYEFCNSAYLNPNNFTNSIIRLQEIFYLYKIENLCFGDLDYLENTCLYNFAQAIQAGYQGYQTSDEPGEYAKFDEVQRWDYDLYMTALQDICWR